MPTPPPALAKTKRTPRQQDGKGKVAALVCLSWRSTWEIARELAAGELVTVLDDFALPSYDIIAVYPPQRHVPAKVRFFVECLKQAWGAPGYWTGAG